MGVILRWRDVIRSYLPPWLADRPGKNAGFRFVWGMIAPLDAASEMLLQGAVAAFPGRGTPTALQQIGRSRALIRGQGDTDDEYAARLRAWLDTWPKAGSQERVARALHEYLATRPRVRVVNRHGHWVTVNEDGSVEEHDVPFDWDSVSHPARASHWWDMWIIVYDPPWARVTAPIGTSGSVLEGRETGIGHYVTQTERDEIVGLVNAFKSDHTFIRAIVWSYDDTLFDPEAPGTLPDGTWGAWGITSGSSYVLGGRNIVDCRFWEPRS